MLGFEVVRSFGDGDRLFHMEMRRGGRAVSWGTTVLIAPDTTPWGNYRTELLDPEGRQWSIGTYRPGEPD